MWVVADRLRELIDLVLGSLDEPVERAVAGGACALLARPPGPAAGGGDGGVAGGAAAAAAAGAGGVAAARRRGRRRRRRRPPGTGRWRRSRARSRVRSGRRRARSTARCELPAPNGIHFHPPAGLAAAGGARGARRTSPIGWSAITSTACASCSRRRRRCRSRSWSGAVRPGVRGRVVRGRGGERGADVRAARVHARGVGGGDGGRAGAGGRRATWLPRFERAALAFERLAKAHPRPRRASTTRSSTRCASRRGRSPTAACSRTCWPMARSGARRSPSVLGGAGRRGAVDAAIRSCGRRLRARGSGWPGTRRCPEGRRAPAGRCSRSGGGCRRSG